MKQIQGFTAQYDRTRKKAICAEYWKAQDDIMALSDENKNKKKMILDDSHHTAKTNTMATDIFRAFLSLFKRCFLAFTEGSPGIFCDLILMAMEK